MASASFGPRPILRAHPFDFQRFLSEQTRKFTMSNDGEKARSSGEVSRHEQTLPTVNPAAEKQEPPKPTFHPAVYVT